MIAFSSMHGLLADSDIWSEVISLIVVFVFFAIPAILKGLAESGKKRTLQSAEPDDTDRHEKTYSKRIQVQREKRRKEFQSDWDRRQEMIRQRLSRLREGQENPHVRPPARPVPIHVAPEQPLPLAAAIPEETRPPAPSRPIPAAPQAVRPVILKQPQVQSIPVPQRLPESPPRPREPQRGPRQRPVTASGQLPQRSLIEKIIRRSDPYKAAIILKEILDKPRALRPDTEF
jgi:hypothetical protein